MPEHAEMWQDHKGQTLVRFYSLDFTPEAINVTALARRLTQTPTDQPLLWLDRLNDLRVALWEFDMAGGMSRG